MFCLSHQILIAVLIVTEHHGKAVYGKRAVLADAVVFGSQSFQWLSHFQT